MLDLEKLLAEVEAGRNLSVAEFDAQRMLEIRRTIALEAIADELKFLNTVVRAIDEHGMRSR